MRRTLVSLVILTGAMIGFLPGGAEAADREVRVGVILPLTGDFAQWGEQCRKGLELAIENENERRSTRLELVFADTESTPEGTQSAFRQVTAKGVAAVIGPITTRNTFALIDDLARRPVPLVLPEATGDDLPERSASIFRVCFNNSYQGAAMALFAREELGTARTGVLYDETDAYSREVARAFAEGFTAAGGRVVASFGCAREDRTDYAKELLLFSEAGAQVIALPVLAHPAVAILKQARELGATYAFIGADGWENEPLLAAAGDAAVGNYFTAHFAADAPFHPARAFVERYRKKYPTEMPTSDAALGYDAGLAVADAASRAPDPDDPEDMTDALETVENLPGVTGFITIGPDHQVDKGVVILRTTPTGSSFVRRYPPTGRYLEDDALFMP